MLRQLSRRIAGSRQGRYWLKKLSNHPDFEPLYDLMTERVPAGLRRLRELGFVPGLVVDAGAYEGHWTRMALPIFPEAQFVMLEAQPGKEAALRQAAASAPGRADVVIGLLGASPQASAPFFLAETGSSLYAENTAFAREQTTLAMRTLDQALEPYADRASILLKLDVQGAELDVLAGASATLRRTEIVLLEVSLVEYNAGAPRAAEVIATMGRLGFLPFDVLDLRRIGPVLAQTDIVFAREGSKLDRAAREVVSRYGSS